MRVELLHEIDLYPSTRRESYFKHDRFAGERGYAKLIDVAKTSGSGISKSFQWTGTVKAEIIAARLNCSRLSYFPTSITVGSMVEIDLVVSLIIV